MIRLDRRAKKARQPPAVSVEYRLGKQTRQGGCRAVNDTKIASKAKAQLAHFMGKVFTHFSKPSRKFVEECIYGIQASGDTKLSSIVRAIDDDIKPIYTEKRLSRNLDGDGIGDDVAAAVLEAEAASVRGDTLLLADILDIDDG